MLLVLSFTATLARVGLVALITERNAVLASNIQRAAASIGSEADSAAVGGAVRSSANDEGSESRGVLAVVGLAHLNGVMQILQSGDGSSREPILSTSPPTLEVASAEEESRFTFLDGGSNLLAAEARAAHPPRRSVFSSLSWLAIATSWPRAPQPSSAASLPPHQARATGRDDIQPSRLSLVSYASLEPVPPTSRRIILCRHVRASVSRSILVAFRLRLSSGACLLWTSPLLCNCHICPCPCS